MPAPTRSALPETEPFDFDYRGGDVVYGRGRIADLPAVLADRGLEDALLVCGSNVGANDELLDPIRRALGDRLAGVFDETTPAKAVETVYDGIDAMRDAEPDVLLGVGGGSSLDIARQMSVFAADGRSLAAVRRAARDGAVEPPDPDGSTTPVAVVPTTFAGADLASGSSVTVLEADASPTGQPIRTGGSIDPVAMCYDPQLFETTPATALEGSAMNGFDKGIETIYAARSSPITDATATRGLRLLSEALPRLDRDEPTAMERAVVGAILVQFERRGSIIHAFGHAFARRYPVQQGVVHAVLAPHVVRYVLRGVDGRRRCLAEAFGVDPAVHSDAELAERIVEEIAAVRDGLAVPTRLRDVEGIDERAFPAIAEFVLADDLLARAPDGLEPTADGIESVLEEAW